MKLLLQEDDIRLISRCADLCAHRLNPIRRNRIISLVEKVLNKRCIDDKEELDAIMILLSVFCNRSSGESTNAVTIKPKKEKEIEDYDIDNNEVFRLIEEMRLFKERVYSDGENKDHSIRQ